MDKNIHIGYQREVAPYEGHVEVVERKGRGHPDTICDGVVEHASVALSRYYLNEFGMILHHNLDKALLVGGEAIPSYRGGRVVKPVELIIVGRAIRDLKGKELPVDEVVMDAVKLWLKRFIRHIDVEKHVSVSTKIRPGSRELVELFKRYGKQKGVPLSNDTSIGVGFFPLDELETAVYRTEKLLNSSEVKVRYPFIGEDVKVIGVREGHRARLTVAMAVVDRYVENLRDYVEKVSEVRRFLLENVNTDTMELDIAINTADNYDTESIYMTVTGTSAEQGDDGQVGRGNRANGLITPYRPMSLEAVCGKNPVNHVGKIYNIFAMELSRAIVERGYAKESSVYIVSQIGKPINEPLILDIKVRGDDADMESIRKLAECMLDEIPGFWKKALEMGYVEV
ncbi:MAG: putative S-adenosylmethionine synthase [Deltaproteobacteria bacterium]|jgi:S-adenosylmethionine synthetase|nr:MAG: putative S-adenosylmethionine synthase [Deltaproteobacteria bacterium]